MVADIQLLQGKIIDDPDQRAHSIAGFIEELTREFIAVKSAAHEETTRNISEVTPDEDDEVLARAERLVGGNA